MVSSRSPRVLLIGQTPPPVHGSNVMAQVLLEALGTLGVEHRLLDKGLSARLDEVGRFSPVKALRVLRFYGRALRETLRTGPAVVISMVAVTRVAYLIELPVLLILRARGYRVLLYIHGSDYRGKAAKSRIRERLYAVGFRLAERTVVLSETLSHDIATWVPRASISIIPNCLPVATEYPEQRPAAPFTALFLGNLIRAKGPIAFLEAARACAARLPEARFVLAGGDIEPDTSADIARVVEQAQLGERLVLSGAVSGEAKRQLFATSHVFVFPTRYDVLPLAVLEAMEAGLPVIASPAGGVPDMVVEGVTGFLVPADDIAAIGAKVESLARDPNLRDAMGDAGRKRYLTEFSRPAFERRWATLLHELGVRVPAGLPAEPPGAL